LALTATEPTTTGPSRFGCGPKTGQNRLGRKPVATGCQLVATGFLYYFYCLVQHLIILLQPLIILLHHLITSTVSCVGPRWPFLAASAAMGPCWPASAVVTKGWVRDVL